MPRPAGSGRKKGQLNHRTVEAKELAGNLVRSLKYRRMLRTKLEDGTLSPAMEAVLWSYAYGRPTERHEIGGIDGGPVVYEFHNHIEKASS